MAENSGGGSLGTVVKWQCMHCPASLLGVSPDAIDFCFKCGEKQEQKEDPMCVNPDCKEQLFSDKAALCHKCNAPQQTVGKSESVEQHKQNIAQAVESKKKENQASSPSTTPSVPGQGDQASEGVSEKPQQPIHKDQPATSMPSASTLPDNQSAGPGDRGDEIVVLDKPETKGGKLCICMCIQID